MNLNTTQSDNDARADEAAALWAARLEGSTLGADDRDELDAWLAENPAHRPALARYCQFSADLEQQVGALVSVGLVEMPAARRESRRSEARKGFGLGWLVAGALAAAVAVVGYRALAPRAPASVAHGTPYATGVAEQKTVTLADGTIVELNAQTRLTFVNGSAERRVSLEAGEAYFSVAKLSPVVPFFVESTAGTVRVTGTHFAVRAESTTELEVTVEEGSVEVAPSPATGARATSPVALKANDRLSILDGSITKTVLTALDLENALKWRQKMVAFSATPLSSAAARFSRYNGVKIAVAPEVRRQGISGSWSPTDFEGFLKYIETPGTLPDPVKVTPASDGSIAIDPAR